jgi:hypothetical protein
MGMFTKICQHIPVLVKTRKTYSAIFHVWAGNLQKGGVPGPFAKVKGQIVTNMPKWLRHACSF